MYLIYLKDDNVLNVTRFVLISKQFHPFLEVVLLQKCRKFCNFIAVAIGTNKSMLNQTL